MSQFQPPEPEPYAKYKLRHYGYNNGLDRGKLSATPSYDYEDVKVKPVLQTTVTFGEGLKSPAELFGSLKKAGQRFVGAEKLVGSFNGFQKLSNHKSKCQCRHHQKKLLQNTGDVDNDGHKHKLFDINESEPNNEGYIYKPCKIIWTKQLIFLVFSR